jgi:hypothetical protein
VLAILVLAILVLTILVLAILVLAIQVFLQRTDDGVPDFVTTDSGLSFRQVLKISFCQSVICSDQLIHLVYPAIYFS